MEKSVSCSVIMIVFFVVALFLGNFLYGLESESDEDSLEVNRNISKPVMGEFNSNFSIRDGSMSYFSEEKGGSQEVWDCTGLNSCEKKKINMTYSVCDTWWNPSSNHEDKCIRTSRGLGLVSLVSDRANHVTAPYTGQNYGIESFSSKELFKNSSYQQEYLSKPWNIEIIDSSQKLISTRDGKIYHMSNDQVSEKYSLNVYSNETGSGLLGVVAHPEFDENQKIYVYYTYKGDEDSEDNSYGLSRVSSFELEDSLVNEEVLINEIPGSKEHYGGRIRLGPNQKNIYITTGDAYAPDRTQEKDFLGGKILRIGLNGEVPEENPWQNEVYAKGLRNPQGIDFHPINKSLLITQHGSWRRDELRKVGKGASGSMPNPCQVSDPMNFNQSQPLFCGQTYTLSPSGMAVIDDPDSKWYGDVFVATLRGKGLYRFVFDDKLNLVKNELFYVSESKEVTTRIRDVEFQDGELWLIGDATGLAKITP